MSVRTTQGAVMGVLQKDYNGKSNLYPFMVAASVIIDNMVNCAASLGKTVDTAVLVEIETWVAAWAYCQNDRTYSELEMSAGISKTHGVYAGQTGKGLDSNFYGQTAKLMDPTGCLARVDEKQIEMGMTWLGLPPSQQTPTWQRR